MTCDGLSEPAEHAEPLDATNAFDIQARQQRNTVRTAHDKGNHVCQTIFRAVKQFRSRQFFSIAELNLSASNFIHQVKKPVASQIFHRGDEAMIPLHFPFPRAVRFRVRRRTIGSGMQRRFYP